MPTKTYQLNERQQSAFLPAFIRQARQAGYEVDVEMCEQGNKRLCPDCAGSGVMRIEHDDAVCVTCDGFGLVEEVRG